MINVGMYYDVKPGHENEFESIFSGVAESLRSSGTGIKDAKLYREVGKREYLIYSEWESLDAFKQFMQSRAFGETISRGKEIIEGRPRHKVLASVEGF
jgi:heme-degrading monooxygenase HmoA